MIKQTVFHTPRLRLVAGDGALLRAELSGRTAFAQALGCLVPDEWPPELYDESAVRWALGLHEKLPAGAIWHSYYFVLDAPERVLIGVGGFKGPPDAERRVEIGYGVLEAHQRRGYATEASQALIALAYLHGAREIIAETLPELVASRRVMEKCGLSFVGEGSEAGVIRYRHYPEPVE